MGGVGGAPDIAGNGDLGGTGAAGNSGTVGTAGTAGTGGIDGTGGTPVRVNVGDLEPFSFFVTSLEALQRLSGSQDGFGGDLRYGEADGLSGADKICTEIAEYSMPGAGAKGWRAFLSATKGGPDGGPVHAIDRIGEGPWYDRLGRVLSMTKEELIAPRPQGADPAIKNNFPNEYGVNNYDPDGTGPVDNHDMLTGTGTDGHLFGTALQTCNDWTSANGPDGTPHVGHSWPRAHEFGVGELIAAFGMGHWMSVFDEAGCGAGVNIIEMGPPNPALGLTVGSGGGYGGFYCFALTP